MSGSEAKTQQIKGQAEQTKEETVVTKITSLFLNQKQLYNLNDLPDTLRVLNAQMNFISDISPISLLKCLYSLNLSNNKISNLKPLENLPNMQILDLSNNNISDISWLKNLKIMTKLTLNGNMISDISQIQHCNQLTDLQIANNYLDDIGGIQNFINLKRIDLSHNKLKEIQALSQIKQLIDLNLERNNVETTISLDDLTNLQKLNINDNPIKTLSLKNKQKLNYLHMRSTTNKNLDDLSNLFELQILDISYNNLKSLIFINNLIKLIQIDISGNQIQSLNIQLDELQTLNASNCLIEQLQLIKVPKLIHLNIHQNKISIQQQLYSIIINNKIITTLNLSGISMQREDLQIISTLANLTKLYLKQCNIDSINFLTQSLVEEKLNDKAQKVRNLISLQCLDVSDNNLKNVDRLSKFTNLKELYINGNQLQNISKLSKLVKLQKLDVSNNKCCDQTNFIDPIGALIDLQYLNISGNQIENITVLQKLNNLQQLDISNNKISSIDSLLSLINLRELDMHSNLIESINALSKLQNLQVLDIYDNKKIINYNPLSGLVQLQLFNLKNTQVQNPQFKTQTINSENLKSLTKLKNLDISLNKIHFSILQNIDNFAQMQQLNLRQTGIKSIRTLSKLKRLQYLDISNNDIDNMDSIGSLDKLEYLKVSEYQMHMVIALIRQFQSTSLKKLHDLEIFIENYTKQDNYDQIFDYLYNHDDYPLYLTHFEYIRRLNIVGGDDNQMITQPQLLFQILQYFSNVRELKLDRLELVNIDFLQNFQELQHLSLFSNKINDISVLKHCNQLQTLIIDMNEIIEINPLKDLSYLEKLDATQNLVTDETSLNNHQNFCSKNKQLLRIYFTNQMKKLQKLIHQELNQRKENKYLNKNLIKLLNITYIFSICSTNLYYLIAYVHNDCM
ncbi:Conserved_hypothetical protein [Hexamita inflata]|uniref:Chaoptin n=1 Tax=Hexamita inflata TaxID=28002 RepID=A0ABP1HQW7_9EUKA